MGENSTNKPSMKWFNFYTKVMIIFCILQALSLSIYGNYFLQGIYNYNILLLLVLDISIVIYQFHVYYSLQKKDINSVNKLIIMLFINFGIKSITTSISQPGSFTQNIIICIGIFSIYYIPNIIYFIKRRNVFNNITSSNSQTKEKNTSRAKTQENKNIENKTKKDINYNAILITLTSLLVAVLLFIGIYSVVDYINSLKSQIETSQNSYNRIKSNYEKLQTEYSEKKMEYFKKNIKLNFYDENIVFVLRGYGNYYYTYDEMKQVTQGKEYSFWAYNKSSAISLGYQPFSN